MPEVTRLTETEQAAEGYRVQTQAGGDTYQYDLRKSGEDTVSLMAKRVNGNMVSVEDGVTETVEEAMEERGYQVES